ncbi:MAG: Hsp20/alpha crystallin family protein, partial [Chloroflexota bacterium]
HMEEYHMSIVIRRNPVREMAAIQSAMDRFFDETWRNFEGNTDATLAVDVHESDQNYLLMANLPGVNSDDIDITLHDGTLTISADLPQPEVNEGVRVRVQERAYGSYSRSLRLPKAVDGDSVEAAYDNGVLVLTLPKSADAQPRQIPIRANATLSEG